MLSKKPAINCTFHSRPQLLLRRAGIPSNAGEERLDAVGEPVYAVANSGRVERNENEGWHQKAAPSSVVPQPHSDIA